ARGRLLLRNQRNASLRVKGCARVRGAANDTRARGRARVRSHGVDTPPVAHTSACKAVGATRRYVESRNHASLGKLAFNKVRTCTEGGGHYKMSFELTLRWNRGSIDHV